MRAILTMLVLAATLAGCASGARLGEKQDLGTFRLGHNVVVATNATKGPFSRDASAEELQAALSGEIDRRFSRYDGDKFFHLGISVDGYILALPGIPLVASPKSALIISVRVWDDAAGVKLTEEPHQITVLESFSGETMVGSGLTRSKEEQLQNLVQNAALAVEKYLASHPEWFQPDPAAEGEEVAAAAEAPEAAQTAPRPRP